jgi:hypothetical protein
MSYFKSINNVGTVNSGTINSGTINAGTINSGTINAGTINSATITTGSIVVTAGTIAAHAVTAATITAGTLNAGTINSGTINAGTINSGTINAATINAGTMILKDAYGFLPEFTPMNEIRVITPSRLVGATFLGTAVDSNFWTVGTSASATVSQANCQVTLNTGTAAAGSAALNSVRTGRYTGGQANRFRTQMQLGDAGTVLNVREWGAFNGTDGASFQLNGSALNVVTYKTGTATAVGTANWTVPVAPTLTDVNSYEIYYTNSKVYFVISGTLVHTVSATTTTWTDTTNFPVRISNINSGTQNANLTLQSRVATIYRLGDLHTAPIYKHSNTAATTTYKNSQGILNRIIINAPTNNIITIYDSIGTSANVMAVLSNGANATPYVMDYEVPFYNGLTIVTAGTPDLTINYE